jgi:predicted ArsR family transcriptional regulator
MSRHDIAAADSAIQRLGKAGTLTTRTLADDLGITSREARAILQIEARRGLVVEITINDPALQTEHEKPGRPCRPWELRYP